MKRYNIFNQIHKALRALLYDTSLQLQQADFSDDLQTEKVCSQAQMVLEKFEEHAHTEDHFILPRLTAYEPSICDAFEQEHVEDMQLARGVADLLEEIRKAASIEARKELGQQLVISFVDFMVFNLDHMKEEEDVLNKLLWRYYSDEELAAITREIVASIPPEKMGAISVWMMRGMANDEIIVWLGEVRANAPEFVYQALAAVAASELKPERWEYIQQQLSNRKMVA